MLIKYLRISLQHNLQVNNMIYAIGSAVFCVVLTHYLYKKLATDISLFPGFLPIIGHILELGKPDIFEKMAAVAEKQPIFKLNIFLKDIAVIVDPSMLPDYFKATEKEMSMYNVLEGLYFWEALSDNPSAFSKIIHILRKSLMTDMKKYISKIREEATYELSLIESGPIDMLAMCKRFVANTSSKCFLGRRLTVAEYNILREFSDLFNFIIVMTYFLPRQVISMIWGSKLRKLRIRLRESFYPDIKTFIYGTNIVKSSVIDYSLDTQNEEVSEYEKMTNTGDIIVSLLYVATENTALGISNTIYDAITHSEVWQQIEDDDCEDVISNRYIDSVVWETARLNSHMFSINRSSGTISTFNGWDISNISSLVISNQTMMIYGKEAGKMFPNPLVYDPARYTNKEHLKTMKNIITWGYGTHGCIGRLFAQYETKIFLHALCTSHCLPQIIKAEKLNYFSPSAYAERKYIANITAPLVRCVQLANGHNIYIARDILSKETQISIFYDLFNVYDVKKGITKSGNYGILKFHNLAYTGGSNCDYKEYPFVSALIKSIDYLNDFRPNSTYATLMSSAGMPPHVDKYVDIGISLGLGADADFMIEDKVFRLHSGDIVITNFGALTHSIIRTYKETTPKWFRGLVGQKYGNNKFNRCSLQIREVCKYADPLMTFNEFINMQ